MKITYVIQKSRRLSISVSVMTDSRVLVKVPYGTTERTVQEFLFLKRTGLQSIWKNRIDNM